MTAAAAAVEAAAAAALVAAAAVEAAMLAGVGVVTAVAAAVAAAAAAAVAVVTAVAAAVTKVGRSTIEVEENDRVWLDFKLALICTVVVGEAVPVADETLIGRSLVISVGSKSIAPVLSTGHPSRYWPLLPLR